MKAIFSIELWKDVSPDSQAYAELCLPATDDELLDALDKLRLEEGSEPNWEVVQYHAFPQLGKFCVENGFVPETEDFSETQLAMLDFEKIGREQRQAEGGVFTSGVYVTQHSALRKAPEPPPLGVPDHTILLEVSKEANDPPAQLKPPAALEEVETCWSWRYLERRDGQPVQAMKQRSGMEMAGF